MPAALLHHGRKTPYAVNMLGLVFDRKTRPAFLDRQPDSTTLQNVGTKLGFEVGTITYQWKAGGVAIAGANSNTLVLGAGQVGQAITVTASYTDSQGTAESVASSAITVVVAVPAGFFGTAGADTLNGTTGADLMSGLAGDDTYVVNQAGDLVVENLNEGIDLVKASVSYTLTDNVEKLTLTGTGTGTGTGNINGTGNALNNTLTGNAGNNILNGGEGGLSCAWATGLP